MILPTTVATGPASPAAHRDVHLLFEPAGAGYRVIVLDAPVRPPASRTFLLPVGLDALLAGLGRRTHPAGTANIPDGHRAAGDLADDPADEETADEETARAIGTALFDAVFDAELGACLEASLAAARASGAAGIRLRLQFADCPELTALAWELLYDRDRRAHLALSVESPVVRSPGIHDAAPHAALPIGGPLRVLVVTAAGHDTTVSTDRRSALLTSALAPLMARRAITVERTVGPSLAELAGLLGRAEYHVLHYVGHRHLDAASGDDVFAPARPAHPHPPIGSGRPTAGCELAEVLRAHRSLRLVLLDAGAGSTRGSTVASTNGDPFGAVAASLVQAGVPAAVSMQFEISDGATVALAAACYESLVAGDPVDVAVAQGRNAMRQAHHVTAWAAPVVHLRGAAERPCGPTVRSAIGHHAATEHGAHAVVPVLAANAQDREPITEPRRRRWRLRSRPGALAPLA